jgi:hypothetical protein
MRCLLVDGYGKSTRERALYASLASVARSSLSRHAAALVPGGADIVEVDLAGLARYVYEPWQIRPRDTPDRRYCDP